MDFNYWFGILAGLPEPVFCFSPSLCTCSKLVEFHSQGGTLTPSTMEVLSGIPNMTRMCVCRAQTVPSDGVCTELQAASPQAQVSCGEAFNEI